MFELTDRGITMKIKAEWPGAVQDKNYWPKEKFIRASIQYGSCADRSSIVFEFIEIWAGMFKRRYAGEQEIVKNLIRFDLSDLIGKGYLFALFKFITEDELTFSNMLKHLGSFLAIVIRELEPDDAKVKALREFAPGNTAIMRGEQSHD